MGVQLVRWDQTKSQAQSAHFNGSTFVSLLMWTVTQGYDLRRLSIFRRGGVCEIKPVAHLQAGKLFIQLVVLLAQVCQLLLRLRI